MDLSNTSQYNGVYEKKRNLGKDILEPTAGFFPILLDLSRHIVSYNWVKQFDATRRIFKSTTPALCSKQTERKVKCLNISQVPNKYILVLLTLIKRLNKLFHLPMISKLELIMSTAKGVSFIDAAY